MHKLSLSFQMLWHLATKTSGALTSGCCCQGSLYENKPGVLWSTWPFFTTCAFMNPVIRSRGPPGEAAHVKKKEIIHFISIFQWQIYWEEIILTIIHSYISIHRYINICINSYIYKWLCKIWLIGQIQRVSAVFEGLYCEFSFRPDCNTVWYAVRCSHAALPSHFFLLVLCFPCFFLFLC